MAGHTNDIDRMSPIPAYHQIENNIRLLVKTSKLKQGDRLEPELRLAEYYKVSRDTVRKALSNLEKDGIVRREHGRGTFIESDPRVEATELSIFHAVSSDEGSRASVLEQRILTDPYPNVVKHLNIEPDTAVVYTRRLFYKDGRPIAVSNSYIVSSLVPQMAELPLIGNSISQTLAVRYGIEPHHMDDYIEAALATPSEVDLLGCSYGSPIILVEGLSWVDESTPLEYSTTLWSGDYTRFHIHLL